MHKAHSDNLIAAIMSEFGYTRDQAKTALFQALYTRQQFPDEVVIKPIGYKLRQERKVFNAK